MQPIAFHSKHALLTLLAIGLVATCRHAATTNQVPTTAAELTSITALIVPLVIALLVVLRMPHAGAHSPQLLATQLEAIVKSRDYLQRLGGGTDISLAPIREQINLLLCQTSALATELDRRTKEVLDGNVELTRQLSAQLRMTGELQQLQQQSRLCAERAGMAETATHVLHNVGNLLNSINISAALVHELLGGSYISELARAVELFQQHQSDLADFLTNEPQGLRLQAFLPNVTQHLVAERQAIATELETLRSGLNHVRNLVVTQQSIAVTAARVETVNIAALLDEALAIESATLAEHHIAISREIAELPLVHLDKPKLLQILINLLQNARDALVAGENETRQLTLRAHLMPGTKLWIEVADNGQGIPAEQLSQVFAFGFTTKPAGHGFGLHACITAAASLGGTLHVHSQGEQRGATFTLELPATPAPVPA